jgi:hypothetical protein
METSKRVGSRKAANASAEGPPPIIATDFFIWQNYHLSKGMVRFLEKVTHF